MNPTNVYNTNIFLYSILFPTIYSEFVYFNEFSLLLFLLGPDSLVECIDTIILPSVNRFLAHAFYVFQKGVSLSNKAVDFTDLKVVKLLSRHQACQTKTIRLQNIFLAVWSIPMSLNSIGGVKPSFWYSFKKRYFVKPFQDHRLKIVSFDDTVDFLSLLLNFTILAHC